VHPCWSCRRVRHATGFLELVGQGGTEQHFVEYENPRRSARREGRESPWTTPEQWAWDEFHIYTCVYDEDLKKDRLGPIVVPAGR